MNRDNCRDEAGKAVLEFVRLLFCSTMAILLGYAMIKTGGPEEGLCAAATFMAGLLLVAGGIARVGAYIFDGV